MKTITLVAVGAMVLVGPSTRKLPGQSPLGQRAIKTEALPREAELSRGVPRGYALIIGVAKYLKLDSDKNLAFSERDARAIHDVLISQEGGNFEPENVRELLGPDATLANISNALESWLPSVAKPDDRVIIYFAGHGIMHGGKGYLAPYDLDPARPEQTGYSMDRLGRIVGSTIPARWKVLLTDACHSGAITPETTNDKLSDMLSGIGSNVLSFTATRKLESSFEDPELGFGVFTYYLVQGLRGHADRDHNGRVTADELVEYVREHVHEHVRRREPEHSQTPYENQDFDPNLVLAFHPTLDGDDGSPPEVELIVEANQNRVEFYLDGRSMGMVDVKKELRLPGIAIGTHLVQGAKEGYEPDGPRQITVYPGRLNRVTLRIRFPKQQKKAAVEFFRDGLRFYNKGGESDCRKAVELFRKALDEDPHYTEAAMYLGRSYQVLFDDRRAEEYLTKAIILAPGYLEARLSLASLQLDAGEDSKPISHLLYVLERDPRNSKAYSHMAHGYFLLEDYEKGVHYANKAKDLDNSNTEAYLWLGQSYRGLGEWRQARQAYNEFLRLSNIGTRIHERVAYYLIATRFADIGSKRRPTQRAVFRDQRNVAFFGLCEAEQKLGQLDLALRHCQQALGYDPEDPFSYYKLGVIHLYRYNEKAEKETLLAAQTCLRKVLAINPDLKEAEYARKNLENIDDLLRQFR